MSWAVPHIYLWELGVGFDQLDLAGGSRSLNFSYKWHIMVR